MYATLFNILSISKTTLCEDRICLSRDATVSCGAKDKIRGTQRIPRKSFFNKINCLMRGVPGDMEHQDMPK